VFTDFKPKFTKRCADLIEAAVNGIKAYIADVKAAPSRTTITAMTMDEKKYEKALYLVEKRKHP
jgi:3-methyl-2-oxobutanoate hydroxymethyltransferase